MCVIYFYFVCMRLYRACGVYVFVYVCLQVCGGVCVHVEVRGWWQVSSSNAAHSVYWSRQGILLIQLVQLASLPRGYLVSVTAALRWQTTDPHDPHCLGAMGITLVQEWGSLSLNTASFAHLVGLSSVLMSFWAIAFRTQLNFIQHLTLPWLSPHPSVCHLHIWTFLPGLWNGVFLLVITKKLVFLGSLALPPSSLSLPTSPQFAVRFARSTYSKAPRMLPSETRSFHIWAPLSFLGLCWPWLLLTIQGCSQGHPPCAPSISLRLCAPPRFCLQLSSWVQSPPIYPPWHFLKIKV